jgi:outer membrane lipoprotein-sorting protein
MNVIFRKLRILVLVGLGLAAPAGAQTPSSPDLERVLDRLDQTAANFHTTEAAFVWNQYQKVVDESDQQKGKVYFRRVDNEIQMAADIAEPDKKYVLFTDSRIEFYQPKIDQVTVYNTGKNRADFESFLVLGFGGRGHDLRNHSM